MKILIFINFPGRLKVAITFFQRILEKFLLNLFEQKWKKFNLYYLPENSQTGEYFPSILENIFSGILYNPQIFFGQNGEKKNPKLPNFFLHSLENPLM
jgi:hypothetical protein